MNLSKTNDGPPPSGDTLQTLLEVAAPFQVAGNTSFFLDQAQACWWLEQGQIELFVVQAQNGSVQGERRHFVTLHAGTLLFGLTQCATLGPSHTLLAVPHVNTVVRHIKREQVQALGADQAPQLSVAIDLWILALCDGLARWVAHNPIIHQSVRPGSAVLAPADHRIASAEGIVWLELPRDATLVLGVQELSPGTATRLFPLSPASWVQCSQALETLARDTVYMLEHSKLWDGLNALHDILLPTAQLNFMLADVDEHNRLRQRKESARRDWALGIGTLRGVLERVGTDQRQSTDDGQPPLVQALQAVGRYEGFEIGSVPRALDEDDNSIALRTLVQINNLRLRRVVLKTGWAEYDTAAMLGFAKNDSRPLAIIPLAGKGIKVIDPTYHAVIQGQQAIDMLASDACVFTAPLPSAALSWKALPKFTVMRGWRDLVAMVLAALAGGLLGMAVPIGSAYLIDTVIPGHDSNHLLQVGIILAILGVATFIMSYVGGLGFSRFQARASPALQAAIIDRLLRLPVRFFRDFSAGDLAMRAGAITQVDQMISSSASQALVGAVFAIYSFALLLYYDWRLGLWAVLLTWIYTLLSLLLIWLQLRAERERASLAGSQQSLTLQMVTGITKIRLSASEDRVFARWATRFAKIPQLGLAAARYGNLQLTLNALFGLIPLFLFFLILGKYRDPAEINVMMLGGLAAFLTAFNNFKGSVTQVTQMITTMLAAQPLLERAMPIMHAVPEISVAKDHPGRLSGAVEFDQVSFQYAPDGPMVLDQVSLSAKAGEFIAIVGPSGCGKSTLIRLLLGFEGTTSGRILLDNKNIDELDILAVRRQMGVVLQNSRLMPGTLYENIVGASDCTLSDVWEAVRHAGLAADIERMPMGLHTMLTEGGSLSGGQIQRLMIARAIVGRPRLLVLDEATSALDNRIQALVTASLEQMSVTRIVIAHRLSTVVKANRIYVMDAGRVVEHGSFDQLMHLEGYFSRLVAAQLV